MLEPRHIIRLQLSGARVSAHDNMPKPNHVMKPLIGQFATLSDAVLTGLLNIDTDTFKRQLQLARSYGVEFICEDKDKNLIGLSAATSLIKSGAVLSKHMIVPHDFMRFDRRLKDHIVIGAFVRGSVADGKLERYDDAVEVAGWTTVKELEWLQKTTPPSTFQSKLPVTAIPCTELNLVEALLKKVSVGTVTV